MMESNFRTLSDKILSQVDDLSKRMDDLEKNISDIMTQVGADFPEK